MKLNTLTITFALLLGIVGAANAEDNYYYQGNDSASTQAYDNSYYLPPAYQGQHYPAETQGAVGYHGTNRTSDARTADEDYYNYYY